jgi:CheY-like chemotaxis protein
MDVQMPEMDGFETTGRIRQTARHGALPILAMTANAMEQDRLACLEAGMNDFITKPVEPETLLELLRRWGRTDAVDAKVAVATAASAPELPLWDLPGALRRMSGNQVLLDRLLEEFRRDQAGDAAALRAALDAGDLKLAEHVAHRLKGVAGNLGARRLQDAAGRLERLLREGRPEETRDPMADLAMVFQDTFASLGSHPEGPS